MGQGICRSPADAAEGKEWTLVGELFADYVTQVGSLSRGALWLDGDTGTLYQGDVILAGLAPAVSRIVCKVSSVIRAKQTLHNSWYIALTPKEQAVLTFLAQQPRKRHTYTDLILNAWNEHERYHGVTNDSLFQVVQSLRQKLEPDPARPIYLVNWCGKPEGGYLLYPEGRPV